MRGDRGDVVHPRACGEHAPPACGGHASHRPGKTVHLAATAAPLERAVAWRRDHPPEGSPGDPDALDAVAALAGARCSLAESVGIEIRPCCRGKFWRFGRNGAAETVRV